MRRHLLTLTALGLGSGACAADLSKTVWDYISGTSRVQPMMQAAKEGRVQKVWLTPLELQAAVALFMYEPKLSTNHWMFVLAGPQLPAEDYLGTKTWSKADTLRDAKDPNFALRFNRLQGGMFSGLYMADELVNRDGRQMRMLLLLTPQMYAQLKKSSNLSSVTKR